MIYSGSTSGFSKFRIHANQDPDTTHVIQVYLEIVNKTTLNSIIKEESINYLPFSISYYSPPVHKVNSKRKKKHFYLSAGSGTIIPDPDPGYSSGSMRIRIHNTGYYYSNKFIKILALCGL